jgi:hypothetical protein
MEGHSAQKSLQANLNLDTLNMAREAATDDATASGGMGIYLYSFFTRWRRMAFDKFPVSVFGKNRFAVDPAQKGGNPRGQHESTVDARSR